METEPLKLSPREIFWRDHQPWLRECGYELRPRYQPDWIPSWRTDPTKLDVLCEDGIPLGGVRAMDAIRIEDGASVALKFISRTIHPEEAKIFQYFSSPELASDPHNHCLPLLAVLYPPDDADIVIFVMKLMRRFDDPRFDTVGEVMDFFHQIFEGLQFMHHHRVAHRDCNSLNIMMDGQHLFPAGFHPRAQRNLQDGFRKAKHYTRTQRPVKYYFIDFGISSKFEPGEDTRVHPILGGDKSVPEFPTLQQMSLAMNTEKLDPFATDIYYLGNLIRTEFLEGEPERLVSAKLGFEFMRPLVAAMVQADPVKRPTIDEVLADFDKIQSSLSSWKLRSRVVKKSEVTVLHLGRVLRHWFRRVEYILRRVPAVPSTKP
ncbi:kinase-like domain-containing protein [Mycena polygramma]|nr:kinase-like domain-containing protein [Mycena polygramma]